MAVPLPSERTLSPGEQRRITWYRIQKLYEGYFFLAPNITGFLIFTAFPVVAALALSCFRWDLLSPPVFVGAAQFRELCSTIRSSVALRSIPSTSPLAPCRCVWSCRWRWPWRSTSRCVASPFTGPFYFMPVVSSLVAAALVWQWIFNGNFGILNSVLWAINGFTGLSIRPPDWLNSTTWALPAVMLLNLWKNAGFTMVIYLAGLQAIPQEFYEAAEVDGAGGWAKLRYVTLPMVSPTTFFVLIMSLIWAFQVFEESYIMTKGGPAFATTTVVYYIYLNAFRWFRMGKAAALAWLLFAVIFVFTLLQVRWQRRWVHYEGERE